MHIIPTLILASFAAAQAPAADKPAEVDGKKVFGAKCVTCHGKDGKGSAAMAKMFKLEPAKLDLTSADNQKGKDADLQKAITAGNGKMPAFKDKLKEAEISAVLAYVRTLAPKPVEAGKDKGDDKKN